MKMPSVMKHSFSMVPRAEIQRSVFDRSHSYKTTFDENYLIPFYIDEALPGDTFNVDVTLFTRLASPLSVPIMDNAYLDTFFFAIPNRLVWEHWKEFCGEQLNPNSTTSYSVPQIVSPASTGWAAGTLSDYFGLPTGVVGLSVSALWHRSYNLCWNSWFRDENLQNSVTVDVGDAASTNSNYVLLKRCKRHDYFTSALPWPQKATAVSLPLGTIAPVRGISKATGVFGDSNQTGYEFNNPSPVTYPYSAAASDASADTIFRIQGTAASASTPQIYADLSSATAATINSLRQAFQVQKLYERDARGGTRYAEVLMSHFGVSDPQHAVLQRPVFLGGKSTPLNITPITSNAPLSGLGGTPTPYDSAERPLGDVGGMCVGASMRDGFTKSFTEHCLILGLCSVRADLTYQNGIPRMFSRLTRFDYYWPALAHLGEQAVLNKEIFADASSADNGVFGYQERFAEYRYYNSKITGQLRSQFATPLDMWHLAQNFATLPTLSSAFIEENVPIARVVAVPGYPHFILDAFIKCKAARPMPVFSVPGLIDHF